MNNSEKKTSAWWIDKLASDNGLTPRPRLLTDQTKGITYQTWATKHTIAPHASAAMNIHDVLKFKAPSLPISTVYINPHGVAYCDLSATMAELLGSARKPQTIEITSPDLQNPAVRHTVGLCIWLKPDVFETKSAQHSNEFQLVLRHKIHLFCKALSAKYHIPIYPAFLPIETDNNTAHAMLAIMSDSKGQNKLMATVREDLLRELTKIRDALPDSNSRPSAKR